MISSNHTSTQPGHHRRQLSQPFESRSTPRQMAGAPSYRAHRRGQTVDYAALGPQVASANRITRRPAPKTVPELRDFFNEKSGFSHQSDIAHQMPTQLRHAEQALFHNGLPLQSSYNPTSYMMSQEELQAMCGAVTADTQSNTYAPALARSASDNAGNTPSMHNVLHRLQQERSFPMIKREDTSLYSWPEPQPIVQPKAVSPPKINAFNSYTSPLTPDATPMKASFDFPMYRNDQTPTKSQSFSMPRTPVSAAMQRARSLQSVPISSPLHAKHQMPSPADSASMNSFAELAAMPSPGSRGVSPHSFDESATPSTSHHDFGSSPGSPLDEEIPNLPAGVDEYDLDARVKASVRETGVSNDEIAKYISGPNAEGKWKCLYPSCNCEFGRKENIKSHVQTHLDDRPYKCDVCEKEFVRGHDLKRHLKTHTGKKPYICACGARFARHDALTRHRQRDMCVGGMTGNIPKTTRRGRPPKKNRPEMDVRQAKSTRTRQRVADRVIPSSPTQSQQDGPSFTSPNYAPSNAPSAYTPPTSPGNSINNTVSTPVQIGNEISSKFEDDMLPAPLSPPQLAHARYEQAMAQYNPNLIMESSQEYLYSDSALSPHEMSSPHTAPTLAESSVGSEIDFFMTQDPSEQVKEEFGTLTAQSLNDFSNAYFVDSANFPTSSFYPDLPEKPFSGLDNLDDPYADPIDTLSNEFLVDP